MICEYFEKRDDKAVRCLLCPHNCLIENGEKGFCGVRKNTDGLLYALTFEKLISAAVDPIEKKPLYHFLPGSQAFSLGGLGCNLICRHCQNHEISQKRDDLSIDNLYKMSPETIVKKAIEKDCQVLAWTYNEPTIWFEYIKATSSLAQKAGLATALITNGVINEKPLRELLPLVEAYRVDVKGFSNEFYRDLTGFPFLKRVLHNAEIAFESGCHVEIVTNIIPGMNDDEEQIEGIIQWIKEKLSPHVPWHVTAYHPAYKLQKPAAHRELLEKIRNKAKDSGLKHIYLGNVYSPEGCNTECPQCGSLLIERYLMSMTSNRLIENQCPDCHFTLPVYRGSLSSR